jgi:quercetin dioxygenase-like cupin family protein
MIGRTVSQYVILGKTSQDWHTEHNSNIRPRNDRRRTKMFLNKIWIALTLSVVFVSAGVALKGGKDASKAQSEVEGQNKAIVATPTDTKSTKIRRVVTGHTPDGKAIVASDTKVDGVTVGSLPGAEFHKLWGADEAPTFPDDGSPRPARLWFPPVGGFRFAMFTMAPLSTAQEEDIDWEVVGQELEKKLPGVVSQANAESDHPGMHTTDTIDFEYVVSGEVWLELDDGVEVHLKAGDTVVQNGTRHAWRNKGSEPCRMVVFLVGAHRS